jgi:hypothetical protein
MKKTKHIRHHTMIKPPNNLIKMSEKREWLEHEVSLPDEMKQSSAYKSLDDEAKIILMLMMAKATV